jgi:L-rhamnose isomerase
MCVHYHKINYKKISYFLNIPVWAVSGCLKMQFQSFPGKETQSANPYERLRKIWKINKLAKSGRIVSLILKN